MHERTRRSGRTGGAGEQTVTTRDEGRRRGAKERLRGMSFEEQEAALRPEPEPEGKKKSKGLGGALKKIFGKKKDKAPKAAPLEMEIGGPTDVQRVPCVGQTNQVGLSRAGFEEGAGRNLVAVRGPAEGCRRAVE